MTPEIKKSTSWNVRSIRDISKTQNRTIYFVTLKGNRITEFWMLCVFNFSFHLNPIYLRQEFSGLSWMVKRYYIQDCPGSFRGNTETRTITSDFIRPSIESSLTRREKKTHIWWGQVAFYKLLTGTRLENSSVCTKQNYMEVSDIFPCYMMKFLCYSCSQVWGR